MPAHDVFPKEVLRYGAYVCIGAGEESDRRALREAAVPALAQRLRLRNEFELEAGPPQDTIAFLRRVDAAAGDLATTACSGRAPSCTWRRRRAHRSKRSARRSCVCSRPSPSPAC